MFKDRKIKKIIQEATKQKKTTEDFCLENNIVMTKQKKVKQPKLLFAKIFAPVAFACVLSVSILLPVLHNFQNQPIDPNTPGVYEPKSYGDHDVGNIRVDTIDELADSKLLLLDAGKIEAVGIINKIYPLDDIDLLLGYSIQEIIYGFMAGNELYAFEFDYMIRCYKNYTFSQLDLFKDLDCTVTHANNEFKYKIFENSLEPIAHIYFKMKDSEYFITLKSFQQMTPINKDTIEVFIKSTF